MKMLPTYQITSFIDLKNLDTAFDGTKPTRNPRRGQWVKLAWLDKRSRFIGASPSGVIHLDHTSGGNNKKFSEKCRAFDLLYSGQLELPFNK